MNMALSMRVMWTAVEELNEKCLQMEREIQRVRDENEALHARLANMNNLLIDDGR